MPVHVIPKEARNSGSPGTTAKNGCESHHLTVGTGNGGHSRHTRGRTLSPACPVPSLLSDRLRPQDVCVEAYEPEDRVSQREDNFPSAAGPRVRVPASEEQSPSKPPSVPNGSHTDLPVATCAPKSQVSPALKRMLSSRPAWIHRENLFQKKKKKEDSS